MSALTPEDLGSMPLFACLPVEQLTLLLDRYRETTHQPDQVILMEQDWGESLFVIRDGLAKVRTYTADGDEVIMSLLGQGDVFGEMAVLDGASRSADVVALTPLHLIKMRSAPFASLLGQLAPFALALARLEAGRLRDLNQRFALQSADATTRLLDGLAYLARKSSVGQDLQAELPPLAQREIALLAGLARETASRTLSKLRSRGTITEQNGRLRLADLKPLLKRGLIS
ncbi:MAG: Crp/Fnr family transcriptional regulator [Synechococcus sp. MIT S9220]|uniref:Crp/Fnr family transcriptional regulator n=1 Tax=unclassified Synechococcus TaxID=2626047 RepID=UPI00164CC6D6|nr:Crp/Fnr family transcriptional regulator [Synechococcus sp. MIT S9220]NOL48340.1 Crp/Fnr family transcriptional regulator [Synechococcus sp. MIT S9220]